MVRSSGIPAAIAGLMLLSGAAMAAPVPDIVAVVTHESRVETQDGVTRTERFQERVVRRDGRVWTERVLPTQRRSDVHDHAKGEVGHRHFDFGTASRYVTRDTAGKLKLEFVDRTHRQVVFVPEAEYGTAGFNGNWDTEAHLAPPLLVERMRVVSKARVDGIDTELREEKRDGWTHRVRWSPSLGYPLSIEAIRDDGTLVRKSTVTIRPVRGDEPAPWSNIAAYDRKTYDDFMD